MNSKNQKQPSRKKKKKRSIGYLVNVMVLTMMALVMLFPLYYVVIVSLADSRELAMSSLYIFPKSIDFSAYKIIINSGMLTQSFLVSIGVAVVGTTVNILLTILAAYPLSKKKLPGRKAFMLVIILTMFFSGQLIPYYLLIKNLGMVNSFWVMIIPTAINTFYIIIMKSHFQSLPDSLEESAKIDGANDLCILIKIILPISKPIIATIILFYAVERWNEWWHALIFISSKNLQPLQIALREVVSNLTVTATSSIGKMIALNSKPINSQSIKMAAVVIASLPIIIVYPFIQKHFVNGIMLGSVKG